MGSLCRRIYRYFITVGMDNMDNTDNIEAAGVPGWACGASPPQPVYN